MIVLIIFGFGIASSDYFFRIPFKNSTLASVLYIKISNSLNLSQEKQFIPPKVISTSRYQLKIAQKFPIKGTFQIAKIDEKNLFVVERFSGESYIWNIETGKTSNQGNLLSDSGIIIGKDKRQIVQITDLHYAFGKLLLSVVLTPKNPNCLSLQAFSFDNPLANRKKSNKFFQSPCIEDTLNPMLFGGRFTNSDESVFMSVGEQRYDRSGYPKISKIALSEQNNPNSVFGTILEFDKKLTSFNIYSRGHRNAQGMFFSATSKKFYEAEHGPQGGDEVNIVLRGKNYGWPFVSFGIPYGWQVASGFPDPATVKGTNYEQVLKKSGQVRGTHEGYQKPLFSWFPSVGAGSLLQVASDSDLLDWRDNLLVVSLTSNQLHRLILDGDKVIFDEKIDVGARIRDMLVSRSGDLVIALDEGTLLAYRP
jgi:hypothetical protein